MSKFVIECPQCGKYAEARTGIFAGRTINCSCGSVIHVRTDKLTSRECPHCGNTVVFDQSKGEKALCPVCHAPINTMAAHQPTVEFPCRQCGIRMVTAKSAAVCTCPVCDCENDVQEQLMRGKIRKENLASVVKYEGSDDALIWKHPIEDFSLGSQLIVHESQEAVFFRDGQALDLFGPGRYTLETQQLPLLKKVYKLPTDTEATFHSEVYFINKTVQTALKWGTPDKVRFIDPLSGVPLELGVSGEMNLQVADSRRLLVRLVGTLKGVAWEERDGFAASLRQTFRPLIVNAVKTNLPAVIREGSVDLLEIDANLDVISQKLLEKIAPGFEEYGLTIPQFYVTGIVLPESDPNFRRIRELHTITLQTRVIQAEATVKTAQAQSEAAYRTAQEQARAAVEAAYREAELQRQTTQTEVERRTAERTVIAAQAEAQAAQVQGMAEAEVMRAKGYTEKDVIQAEVQKAYAAGIGQMGSGGGGGGTGSAGGSGVMGDMLGLGVGLAAAGAVAPQIGSMIQGIRPDAQTAGPSGTAPQTADTWNCTCGQTGIASRFCPNCGAKRPEGPGDAWDCACGQRGITSRFCPNCGAKRPEMPGTWDCTCGQKGIASKFCPNCGKKRED